MKAAITLCLIVAMVCLVEGASYGNPYGQINYKVRYQIDLPKGSHGAAAQWKYQDDATNANYNLQQYHPYGAQSSIYYAQQSNH